ncbi:MAG: AAA family ATPase [Verrucomicrobiales bacterium]|nr:AAA family ATPase [Verrucomicrobiales bacterium]
MSNTYLSKIDISNFRSFGPNFSWEIPPSPSLVIIYGMNGLGKTSFFEALEWLFTGDVRRISSALSKESIDQYLTRRGANELSHFVSATFGPKEDRILRSATKVPSREDVLEALAHPDWEEKPDDITPYLRLTKFLPQSKRYRFEEENPADQWKLLRGPAGVDRLEEIRQALGSTKTTNAFNREITRLKQELEIESNRYRDWSELIVTRDNLTLYSSETDYIDLDRVRRDLDDLEKLLLSKYDVSSLGDAEDLSPKEMSDRFHNRIVDVQSLLRNEESKLESFSNLHSLIMDWSENSSKTQLFSNEIDSKQERLETIGLEIKNLSDGRIAVSENYNNAVEKEKSKDQEISNILNIKSSFNQQTEKITEISNIQKELVQENKELERIRERLKQFEAAKIKRTEIVEMIGTLKKRQNELITFQANVDEFFRRKEESDRREGSIHSLKKELEKARAEKAQNRLRVSELERDRNALIAKRTDILSQVEVMAEALATLCRHIDEDSLECPLCTAKYETGKLQSLARKALEDSGIDTIEIDQGLVQVKDEIEQIKEVEISIDNQIASIPIQIDELERLRTAAGEEWDRIESTRVLIGGISSSNLVQDASSRKGEVEAQIESLENDLSTHEAGEQIDLEITNLTAQKSDYEISIEEKEGRLNEINSEIEHAQAAIVHYRDSNDISEINLELLETMLVNREEEKQIAHDHVNDWRTRVEELNRELQRAEEKQNSLKLELQTLHTKRQSVDERLKVLKQRWEVFFPDVSPTPEPLQRSIALSEETGRN